MTDELKPFLEALGYDEEPFGLFYTDKEPMQGFTPKPGEPVSYEREQCGELNFKDLFENFSCVIGQIWLARKKRCPAYFEATRYGCMGASFFLGFHKPQVDFLTHYISFGLPQFHIEGECYLPSPESVRQFFTDIDPRPAPARFCVFKPLSQFEPDEQPEVVIFFMRPEVLSGLFTLTSFVTGDTNAVAMPFGAGCSNISTWPLKYTAEGKNYAVVGGMDPSCRKFLKTDEMTFAVPYALFLGFLEKWRDSCLCTGQWEGIRKKIARSRKAWGEAESE